MYTIGQVSSMFDLPISTLRYYDKSGLFPELARNSSIRQFDDKELERLRIIQCLKKSGLEIKDIKDYMDWCVEGEATYQLRYDLMQKQKANVEREIERLERIRSMLKFKCWYYEQAMADCGEERLRAMLPDKLPEEIQALYDHAHGK